MAPKPEQDVHGVPVRPTVECWASIDTGIVMDDVDNRRLQVRPNADPVGEALGRSACESVSITRSFEPTE